MTHDLRVLVQVVLGDHPDQPTAAVLDSRTEQSTPEPGARASCDGNKRRNISNIHIAVDSPASLIQPPPTPSLLMTTKGNY